MSYIIEETWRNDFEGNSAIFLEYNRSNFLMLFYSEKREGVFFCL